MAPFLPRSAARHAILRHLGLPDPGLPDPGSPGAGTRPCDLRPPGVASRLASGLRTRLEGSGRRTGLRPVRRMAQAGPAELGRPEGRHLGDVSHLESSAEQVGLGLHQQARRRWRRRRRAGRSAACRPPRSRRRRHRSGGRPPRPRRGPRGRAVLAAGQPGSPRPAPSRSQCGAPSPEKAGTRITPAGAVHLSRELDQISDVPAGRAVRPSRPASSPRTRCCPPGQTSAGRSARPRSPGPADSPPTKAATGVITDDTGAVGGLGQSRGRAALAEQRGVRIGQHGHDRGSVRDTRQARTSPERLVGSPDLRQRSPRHPEECAQLRGPGQIDHVVEQGPRGVAGIAGMDPAAGEPPDQPRIDRADCHVARSTPLAR